MKASDWISFTEQKPKHRDFIITHYNGTVYEGIHWDTRKDWAIPYANSHWQKIELPENKFEKAWRKSGVPEEAKGFFRLGWEASLAK